MANPSDEFRGEGPMTVFRPGKRQDLPLPINFAVPASVRGLNDESVVDDKVIIHCN